MLATHGEVKHPVSGVKAHRRLDTGEARDGGAARKTPTGHGFTRGLLLRLAGDAAHLMERTGGAGVA